MSEEEEAKMDEKNNTSYSGSDGEKEEQNGEVMEVNGEMESDGTESVSSVEKVEEECEKEEEIEECEKEEEIEEVEEECEKEEIEEVEEECEKEEEIEECEKEEEIEEVDGDIDKEMEEIDREEKQERPSSELSLVELESSGSGTEREKQDGAERVEESEKDESPSKIEKRGRTDGDEGGGKEESPSKKAKREKKAAEAKMESVGKRIRKAVEYRETEGGLEWEEELEAMKVSRSPKKKKEVKEEDEIHFMKEVKGKDIEMLEEKDPLALSEADLKKARKEKECKKDTSVIIIDTNTLLKNQGNLAAAAAQSHAAHVSPVNVSTVSHVSTVTNAMNLQSAIQSITGGIQTQGLQSAYITALQQVLLTQGNHQPMSSQHLAQLTQYYHNLGALQDDAYVIEAPSFIVPYVMEGKPKESIKSFLKRINKELEEYEKKKKEEKSKKGEKINNEEKEMKETEEDKDEKKLVDVGKPKEDQDEEVKNEESKEKDEDDEKEADKKEETVEIEKVGKEKEIENEIRKKEKEEEIELKEDESDVESVIDLDKEEKKEEDFSHLGKWESYYRSSLGKFFLELGLNQAQEFLQSDLLRMQKKRLEKMKGGVDKEGIMSVKHLQRQLQWTRQKNAHLATPVKMCRHCSFRTDSGMAMERHLEAPHMLNYTYKCNYCEFETRGPQVILFHMEAEHNVRGRLERAPAFFLCPLCPFEDNNKSKMTRHAFSCVKKYKPEKNCELVDWEPPAKIAKIHRAGRPNTLGKAFEPMRMPNLLPKGLNTLNLATLQPASSSLLAAANAAGRGRGRPVGSYKGPLTVTTSKAGITVARAGGTSTIVQPLQGGTTQQFTLGNQMFQLVNGHLVSMSAPGTALGSVSVSSQARVQRLNNQMGSSSISLIPGLNSSSSSITIQTVQNKHGGNKSPQQPSISITPLPRSTQNTSSHLLQAGKSMKSANGNKASFVICEICDGYIKDLEQLRNHMNLIHKVKIHPKMIYNRPPLNCQKCQHRFFTDQGLERHLLGTHGLVTSSMQECANKGKDAGRCPICGKVFQWKLLNHVSRDHKMSLKPAHLSYKCTVCTATFNMYRLFENHVYSAHSAVTKNKTSSGDGKKTANGSADSGLKMNDEITIIPQSTVKTNGNVKSGKKVAETSPSIVNKEITITKVSQSAVTSRMTRRSTGADAVEVINLDESPVKAKKPNHQEAAMAKKLVSQEVGARKSTNLETISSKKLNSLEAVAKKSASQEVVAKKSTSQDAMNKKTTNQESIRSPDHESKKSSQESPKKSSKSPHEILTMKKRLSKEPVSSASKKAKLS